MRIAFLLQAQASDPLTPHLSAVMRDVVAHLMRSGANVELMVAEQGVHRLDAIEPRHDLYVLKSKTPLTLGFAGALSRAGATLVNSFEATLLAKDKIASTPLLAAAGLPVPPSWATGNPQRLLPLLDREPLWIKPSRGSRGQGVFRALAAADCESLRAPTDAFGLPLPLFAQRDVPSSGRDLKVYVIGERAYAITRPWPAMTLDDKLGQPAELSDEIRTAALACGRVLGLDLYGVDFLCTPNGFFIVDVNALPGYKGIADAPRAVAAHLYQRAQTAG